MNYNKIYKDFIKSRTKAIKNKKPHGFERHHITPRAFGGSNEKSNLVDLTPKEHFFAHLLLAKIHGGKMYGALFFMSQSNTNSGKGCFLSSRQYSMIRKKYRESMSGDRHNKYGTHHTEETKNKIGLGNKGKIISEAQKRNQSLVMKGRKLTAEHKEKISKGMKGKKLGVKHTEETKRKISKTRIERQIPSCRKGEKHTDKTKAILSYKIRNLPKIACPHCSKKGSIGNMKRWHFDNCKHK